MRPDKRAARFHSAPRTERLADAVFVALRRLVGELQAGATLRPSTTQPGRLMLVPAVANMAAPTLTELEAGAPIRVSLHTGNGSDDQLVGSAYDTRYARSSYPSTWSTPVTVTWRGSDPEPDDRPLLERIDDTLASYDASRPDVHTARPYGWL